MSRAALCSLVLLGVGCGRFEPVAEPGAGTISGCLVDDTLSPRADVSVFATRDGSVTRQTRSGPDGCFQLEDVPSGRLVLAVNDFHGHGLTEPLRVYARQNTRLGRRVLESLAINPVMPTLRGVGFLERVSSGSLHSCDAQRLELEVSSPAVQWADLDGVVQPGLLEVEGESAGSRVLRRRASGVVLPLAEDEACWLTARIGPSLALVRGGHLEGGVCLWSTTRQRLVTAEGEFQMGETAFDFTSDGRGARGLEVSQTDATLEEFDGTALVRSTLLNFTLDDRVWLMASDLASRTPSALFMFVSGVTGLRELVLAQPNRPVVRIAVPSGRDVEAAAREGQVTWLTFTTVGPEGRVTDQDDGWTVFDAASGTLKTTQAPSLTPSPQTRWQSPLHFEGGRAQLTGYSPDGLTATVFEHFGDSVRARSLTMPRLSQPNYVSGLTNPWSPVLSLTRVPALGLELLRVGDEAGLRLGREGAPLSEAVPVSSFALPPTPGCVLGEQVYLTGAEPNLSTSVFRYDVARLADELLPPR